MEKIINIFKEEIPAIRFISKRLTSLFIILVLSIMLIGCDKQNRSKEDTKTENVTLEPVTTEEIVEKLSYQDLSEFTFHMYYNPEEEFPVETLTIGKDGTFEGSYSNLDMSMTGEDFSAGTLYYCNYRGTLGELKKINDYTYAISLVEVQFPDEETPDYIQDDMKYVYHPVYDFEYTKRLYLYLPGTPYRELPQTFQASIYIPEGEDTFRCYGLYNALSQYVWTSEYAPEEQMVSVTNQVLTKEAAMQEINFCEEEEQEILEVANSDFATQMIMNMTAGRDYELWDLELNRIWRALKQTLDEEEMNTLLAEQKIWIEEKENAMEAAGKEWEGGSGEPMARSDVGAEYTKKRVYELVEYLK